MKITAESGNIFIRIFDQHSMGNEIELGIDYSTGIAREDLSEYYAEIPDNSWHYSDCNFRIVVPITFVTIYPALLFDLSVIRKLPMEQQAENVLIYCNWIADEHQALINLSQGAMYVETKPD